MKTQFSTKNHLYCGLTNPVTPLFKNPSFLTLRDLTLKFLQNSSTHAILKTSVSIPGGCCIIFVQRPVFTKSYFL